MKKWQWLMILLAVIAVVVALLISDARKDDTYGSLEEIRNDISFCHAETMKEVAFDDYTVFFVAENDNFYYRVFKMKNNGEFLQMEHSPMVGEGSAVSIQWKEFFGDRYFIQFSAHDADVEPYGMKDGMWTYVEEGDYGRWHFSYEILKQNAYGDMVPVEHQ